MVQVFVRCPVHGIQRTDVPLPFGGAISGDITFIGSATNCPLALCGRIVPIVDGSYEFVGGILQAINGRLIDRSDIEAFRELVEDVQQGRITPEQANENILRFHPAVIGLWNWANTNGGGLAAILTVVTILLTYYGIYSSNQSSEEAHADAQKQLAATQSVERSIETGTQVARSEQEVLQKIYEALAQQKAVVAPLAQLKPPQHIAPRPIPPQTPNPAGSGGNRHERRKAACLKRRGKGH